ncbi:TPA: Head virion protein G6P, partial [Pseudomonas aeruginosa]|nr:Head virion protein G6P [Pseudomonas aeruginosa]
MEWLSGFLDQIIAFFQWIWDFFAQGIYDFVRDGLVVATKASMYAALQTLILLIDVSYTAARELIDSLGVPQMIRSMYAA